ncbi:amidohydrolase [Microbulbifer sp. DLAB2-AA]|uniref:amidohydrolase n=1 Tax=Microbulbifer sp. DLAB2-AA TaxID=3243394 RepID=UPI0040396B57
MRLFSLLSVLLLLSCDPLEKSVGSIPTANPTPSKPAQLIVRNATIYTADKARSIAAAMAIRGGRIVFVGTEAGVEAYIGGDTEIVDLNGKLVLPGFFQRAKIRGAASRINLFSGGSIEDYRLAVARYIRENPHQQVIVGDGWNLQAFSVEPPHKGILDQINDLIPIILFSSDRNNIWTNSEGLAATGINNDSVNPPNGFIEKNEHGIATGWLRGPGAVALIEKLIPQDINGDYRKDLLSMQDLAVSNGVTSLYDSVVVLKDEEGQKRYFDQISEIEPMGFRVLASMAVSTDFADKDFSSLQQKVSQITIDDFRLISISYIGWLPENLRVWITTEPISRTTGSLKEVISLAQRANAHQFPIQILVSGEEETDKALNMLEKLEGGDTKIRNAIVNASLDKESTLDQLSQMHSAVFVQPKNIFLLYSGREGSTGGGVLEGGEKYIPMSVSLLSSDPSQILGMVDPMAVIYRGLNLGISIYDLVEAFTINAAYSGGLEKETGSIEKGKWADFIVLDRNIFNISKNQVGEAKVIKTFYKGRSVFDRKSLRNLGDEPRSIQLDNF